MGNLESSTSGLLGNEQVAQLMPLALAFLAMNETNDAGYASIKQDLRTWAKGDPIDALLATVVGGGVAFYLAEHEGNPNCPTIWDGILYMATCLSVGYDNNFPTTPTGHAIAAIVQTFGPALSGMAFDAPAAEARAAAQLAQDADANVNRAILARLDDIVRLLEAQR